MRVTGSSEQGGLRLLAFEVQSFRRGTSWTMPDNQGPLPMVTMDLDGAAEVVLVGAEGYETQRLRAADIPDFEPGPTQPAMPTTVWLRRQQ